MHVLHTGRCIVHLATDLYPGRHCAETDNDDRKRLSDVGPGEQPLQRVTYQAGADHAGQCAYTETEHAQGSNHWVNAGCRPQQYGINHTAGQPAPDTT